MLSPLSHHLTDLHYKNYHLENDFNHMGTVYINDLNHLNYLLLQKDEVNNINSSIYGKKYRLLEVWRKVRLLIIF